jgi:hypothetical protein
LQQENEKKKKKKQASKKKKKFKNFFFSFFGRVSVLQLLVEPLILLQASQNTKRHT